MVHTQLLTLHHDEAPSKTGQLIKPWFLFCQMGLLDWMNTKDAWQPTPVLLPRKAYGWRSLVGCSPWGCEESDRTERLHFHFSLSCIREGNGNPLQYSCLENSMERGAWRAIVHGVAKSQTQLKRLSMLAQSSMRMTLILTRVGGIGASE